MNNINCFLLYQTEDIEKNIEYIKLYEKECARRGLEFNLVRRDASFCSVQNFRGGFVINRSRDAAFAAELEKAGIPVFNSSRVALLGNDKLAALRQMQEWDIPIMKSKESYDAFEGQWPLVLKTRDGHGGSEVFLVHNEEEALRISNTLAGRRLLWQEYCDTPGRDLRIYIVGGRIVAGMLRSSESDFRSNYSLGGSARIHELSPDEKKLTEEILSRLPIAHAGIDLIYHKGNPVFNEIEDVVGSRMLYRYTDIDVVHEYMEYICSSL